MCAFWSEPLQVAHTILLLILSRGSFVNHTVTCVCFCTRWLVFIQDNIFRNWNCISSLYRTTASRGTYGLSIRSNSHNYLGGSQWLSGRVLYSRPRGRGFELHWRHCVVVIEQDTFIIA